MARPRNFDEANVVAWAAEAFGRLGYNATSIDDLLNATGLQRGSLYKAFGSKRALFEKVLRASFTEGWSTRKDVVDLMIIALKEIAPSDRPIADLCRAALELAPGDHAHLLGSRLLENLN